MLKRLVGSTCAVVLAAGSLVAIAATPAPAMNFFVHGNVHCLASGLVKYTPPLRNGVSQTTKAVIKGTLSNCDKGETGLPGQVHSSSGKFKPVSDWFERDCTHRRAPSITTRISWTAPGAKIRD